MICTTILLIQNYMQLVITTKCVGIIYCGAHMGPLLMLVYLRLAHEKAVTSALHLSIEDELSYQISYTGRWV